METMTYQDKMIEAARELRREMAANYKRGSAGMPAAYAVNASDRDNWQIIAVPAGGNPPENGTIIVPMEGGEPYELGWLTVPYSHVRSVLKCSALAAGIMPEGWSEATPGGLMCNPDEIVGGIIDKAIVSGEWFVIFGREDLPLAEGFASRGDAFRYHQNTI